MKSLVVTPTVLAMMNDDLDWTQKLGDAVLAQQADVMDAIQRLRGLAEDNGKLATTKEQKVTTTEEAGKEVIVIEPATPETVYVPYYEPAVVYGAWPYPDYPPYYFPPAPGWVVGGAIASGIAWGAGFAIGNAIWDGFDWNHGNIRVDIDKTVNINNRHDVKRGDWHHDSHHRRGVNYTNNDVRNKYAKGPAKGGDRKLDYRGRDGEQVLKPGDRPGGDHGRPDLGKGPGGDKRADLGKGPGGDKRPDLGKDKGGPGKQAALEGKKPDLSKRPDQDRPKTKNAFDPGDGKKAKDYSKRGQASLGDRSSRDFAKPKAPSGGHKAARPGGGPKAGGGHRGGGQARGGGGGRGAVVAAAAGGVRRMAAMIEGATGMRRKAWLWLCAALVLWFGPAAAQEHFKTPDEAVTALVDAAKAQDKSAILAVLGKEGREVISSGDAVADRAARHKFLAAYDAKHEVDETGDKATLVVGDNDWPFPIPLVKKDDRWSFDTAGGLDEILRRRIGRNELSTIQVCLGYVQAQNEYASLDPAGLGPHAYAQRILSSPGKKDGLYWPTGAARAAEPARRVCRRGVG